jgi:hypothetical protein
LGKLIKNIVDRQPFDSIFLNGFKPARANTMTFGDLPFPAEFPRQR